MCICTLLHTSPRRFDAVLERIGLSRGSVTSQIVMEWDAAATLARMTQARAQAQIQIQGHEDDNGSNVAGAAQLPAGMESRLRL